MPSYRFVRLPLHIYAFGIYLIAFDSFRNWIWHCSFGALNNRLLRDQNECILLWACANILREKKKKKKIALKSGCNKYVKMIILIALLFFFPTQMPINFLLVSEMKNSKEKEKKKRQTAHKYTKKQWQTIDARMRIPMIYFGEINFFEAAKRCTQYEPYKYINICTSFRDCRLRLFVR